MNVLLVEHLSKSYGEKTLFSDITFGLEKGRKVALIAKNGSGKTTILNIISGIESPDDGKVTIRNGQKLAYLSQQPDFPAERKVIDIILNDDNIWSKAVRNYEICIQKIANNDTPENHIELDVAINEIDILNAWEYEHKIKEILSKFQINDLEQKANQLSGGQKKKIALAKALIENADILILDEPTNHLDINMIEWLEEYFQRNQLTLLMVTHDRYFLDQVCDEIIELDNNQIFKYKGGYEYYLEKKDERIAIENAEIGKSKGLYKTELEWMRRMPQARGTKSKARIDAFYELKQKALKRTDNDSFTLSVLTERTGNKILEINNIDFSYGDNTILTDFSYIFKKGERVGIAGPNGCGKSTLLKLITENLKPNKGKIVLGQTIKLGYYSQDGLQLDETKRVIDIVKETAEVIKLKNGSELSAAQFLNHFGFSYNTQWNYFEKLSGGERRRLYLLLTLCKNPNFLLLDEPTNDFDIETMNILEEFLLHFDGCVLVVSHDRYLLDKITDHIFCFEGNGVIKDFYGSYTDYRFQKKSYSKLSKSDITDEIKEDTRTPRLKKIKRTYNEQKEYENLEKQIQDLEIEKAELLQKMNSGNGSAEELTKWSMEYNNIDNKIDEKSMRWLELSEIEE